MSAVLAEGSVYVCVCLRECASSKGHVCILHKCGTKYFPLLHHPGDQQIKLNVLSHHQDPVTFFFFFPASALGSQFTQRLAPCFY